jgi:hypothetical protein
MKHIHLIAETSSPATGERHSPRLERVGKYLFWLLVAAVLVARVAYYPVSHPVASDNQLSEAKTDVAR